jgi:hypothetical protein
MTNLELLSVNGVVMARKNDTDDLMLLSAIEQAGPLLVFKNGGSTDYCISNLVPDGHWKVQCFAGPRGVYVDPRKHPEVFDPSDGISLLEVESSSSVEIVPREPAEPIEVEAEVLYAGKRPTMQGHILEGAMPRVSVTRHTENQLLISFTGLSADFFDQFHLGRGKNQWVRGQSRPRLLMGTHNHAATVAWTNRSRAIGFAVISETAGGELVALWRSEDSPIQPGSYAVSDLICINPEPR